MFFPTKTKTLKNRQRRLGIFMPLALVIFLGVLGPGLLAPNALAQDAPLDRLQAYIERNEELLNWARDLVLETESGPARRVLHQAGDLHQRSISRMTEGRLQLSFGLASRAREAVWSAVGQAREAMGLEERLRIKVEQFRDRYGRLVDRARELQNETALGILNRAEHQAIRAGELYQQGDLRLAMKLFDNAERLVKRAERMLANGTGPEQIDRVIERVANLIDHTRERLGDSADPAALKLLSEAGEALDRSRESRNNGQPDRALRMAGQAGKLARRAARLSGLGPDEEGLRRQLDHFDQRHQRIGDRVHDAHSETARRLFERALELGQQAHSSADDQQVEQALRQIRAAHDLLNQTEDLLR